MRSNRLGEAQENVFALKSMEAWRQDIYLAIAELGELRRYRRHEVLFALDDLPVAAFAVKKGLVEITGISRVGQEITESLRGPGDILGYAEIVLQKPRHRQATVLMDADVWRVDRATFLCMLSDRPDVVTAMLGSALYRIAGLQQTRADFRGSSAKFRVAYMVSRLAASVSPNSDGPVTVRITHEEIGRLCGLTRQTVTMELGTLQLANTLHLGFRAIEVPSIHIIEEYLERIAEEPELAAAF